MITTLDPPDATPAGLTSAEASQLLARFGRNAPREHVAGAWDVLAGQLKNPLLLLLGSTAIISVVLHDRTDAAIILGIVILSVGLGFFNEYRSVRAIAALRSRVRRTARAMRDGVVTTVDVVALVPGDVVLLDVGDIVPADVRLVRARHLACDEASLTGESMPAEKTIAAGPTADAASTALMGTVVRAGSAVGFVIATGTATQAGAIASRLVRAVPQTAFQNGLQSFSALLVWITTAMTSLVFAVNAILRHSILESLLFALAIAVSLTPQLLPAIVTISLATGARKLAARSVLVKRLVCIEDLGNMTVLFTDKTRTLTAGTVAFSAALDIAGRSSPDVLRLGLLCTGEGTHGANAVPGSVTAALDVALWNAADAQHIETTGWRRLAEAPFDYDRRLVSVLVDDGTRRCIITKGAPESVFARCATVPDALRALLATQFADGARVVAVASRAVSGTDTLEIADEHDLIPIGLLTFVDPPKADAAASLARLEQLGVVVKILTGDNELVAQKICRDLAIPVAGTLTGAMLEKMSDTALSASLASTSIFARISPEQKARIIGLQRADRDVGFLGDGMNDAVALHDADVGISVESATDVAKDAADIVLVAKDLGLVADGVVEGRRIFANTIKYVLMATSSNFGNLLSTAIGSMFLPFLPLLPSQILLNNLLYDGSEMTIPTDNVDEESLQRPASWDMGLIKRFMIVFGPLSSLMDLSIFAVLLRFLHAGPVLFRSGYFVESFITQTLIIFVIRTRRVPFFRSRPSAALATTTIGVCIVGTALPFIPTVGPFFGFTPLPIAFFVAMSGLLVVYVAIVELAKRRFFRQLPAATRPRAR